MDRQGMVSAAKLLDLTGGVAVVTGAGQGVGQRIALRLAEFGAAVAVNDIDGERAERVAAQIIDLGGRARGFPADVGDFDEVGAMFAAVAESFGPVGILVNNAGNHGAGPVPDAGVPFWMQQPSDWFGYLHVNLDGVLNATRHAMAHMTAAGRGRVITMISDAARVGETHGLEVYSAAKAGAAGFTRAMARLGGKYGITANAIALGATRTPAIEHLIADERFARQVLSNYVLRRFGEPEDAADLTLFLASGAASWITGQTIPVNGGYAMAL
ncbi:SDR family NAD(P)-dependent oxidoreductase [Nocardia sp. NPDC127579]|uniref:SDR family NAD(P)-dependent oxidoreductase n=1 Tax=Nocardia sp. NPDC127579 TaxID=3345402 RepID=UPI00363D28F0